MLTRQPLIWLRWGDPVFPVAGRERRGPWWGGADETGIGNRRRRDPRDHRRLVDELRGSQAWLAALSPAATAPGGEVIGHVLCTRGHVMRCRCWPPAFGDYLYLSFTNAAAFSPTDVLPSTSSGNRWDRGNRATVRWVESRATARSV
jgi:hypothetical protein